MQAELMTDGERLSVIEKMQQKEMKMAIGGAVNGRAQAARDLKIRMKKMLLVHLNIKREE